MYSYGPPHMAKQKSGRPAETYIQQLCEDTGCSLEEQPEAMNNREEWQERIRDIRAGGTSWWWYIYIYMFIWIYMYIYIYMCVCVCVSVYIYIYIYTPTCTHTFVYVFTYSYICIYISFIFYNYSIILIEWKNDTICKKKDIAQTDIREKTSSKKN